METKGATDAGKGLLGITISVHSFGSGKVHVTFDMAGSNANMKDQYHEPIKIPSANPRYSKPKSTKSRTFFFPAWRLLAHPIWAFTSAGDARWDQWGNMGQLCLGSADQTWRQMWGWFRRRRLLLQSGHRISQRRGKINENHSMPHSAAHLTCLAIACRLAW